MGARRADGRLGVTVLGATGAVGQRLVRLLARHPRFALARLCASERSSGQAYREVVRWSLAEPLPEEAADLPVEPPEPARGGESLVLSALDAAVAGAVETAFAAAGSLVVTNAGAHRMDPDVPLVVPEVNAEHLELAAERPLGAERLRARGAILANPNCSAIGLALALAPIERAFGLERVHVTTLQALSGAGLPGVPALAIADNVIPFIRGEEEKLEREPKKILGRLVQGRIREHPLAISAQCTRVAVSDGHLELVSFATERPATREELLAALASFRGEPQERALPSAPKHPIVVHSAEDAPQPRLHRDLEQGMAVSVGRLRPCPLLGWKMAILSHNTLRGAAGGALLLAELAEARGLVS